MISLIFYEELSARMYRMNRSGLRVEDIMVTSFETIDSAGKRC